MDEHIPNGSDGVHLSLCEPLVQLSKTEEVFSRIISALPEHGMKYEQLSLYTALRTVICDNLFIFTRFHCLSAPLLRRHVSIARTSVDSQTFVL
jgi:hypothetical protein